MIKESRDRECVAKQQRLLKQKVKIRPSREHSGLQQHSSRAQLSGNSLVLCGLIQAAGRNPGISAGGVKAISGFD
jgi:hypothetical protein